MIHASGIRHTLAVIASASLLALAGHASAAVSNVDPEQQRGPDDLDVKADFESQLLDKGKIRDNNTVLHVGVLGRTLFGITTPGSRQGLGVQLDTYTSVGEDQTAPRKIAPGEIVEFNGKVSYLYESLDSGDLPSWEIIPYYEFETYPNLSIQQNYLKWRQHWLGSDFWWCSPVEGLEFGGGAAWDPRHEAHLFKAAVGAREFYQDAPFDLASWQLLNLGNRNFKRYFAGTGQPPPAPAGIHHGGLTTLDLGGKVTLPLPWNEFWIYAQADWSYWLTSSDRRYLNSVHTNSGEFVISIGAEWRPE